jgi:hypothetical protein
MGGSCRRHDIEKKCILYWENLKERGNFRDLDIDGKVILKWFLREWGARVWIGLSG